MTSIRKVLGLLVALALGSFALPAAATYYYSLNMCAYGTGCTSPIAMTTASGVSTGTVTAIIKNESPANLTMKSFTLSVPAGSGLTITGATLPAGQTATKTIQGGTLTVKSMSIGIVKGATYAISLTVTTTSCANITGNWMAQPWTGSMLNGNKFTMYPVSATHPATTFMPACTVPIAITANPAAGGSASCSPNPVPYGAGSTCSASPNSGYTFGMFSGDCSGATCTFTNVISAKTVQANFTLSSYPVTASVSGGHGSIVPTSQSVPFGTTTQLTLTPDAGYQVGPVTGTCGGSLSGSGPSYTWTTGPVPVNGCSVIASFTPISYPVSTARTGNGIGTITPLNPVSTSVPFGTTPTFTVTAAAGSNLGGVTDNCGSGGSLNGSTYTAAPVPVGGCTVTANFTVNTLTFQNQPADAFPGSVITDTPFNNPKGNPIKVQLLVDGSAPPVGTQVAMDSVACSIHGTANTDSSGFVVFSTLSSSASQDVSGCILTASATGFPSPTSNSPFKISIPTGTIGCDPDNNKGGSFDPTTDMAFGPGDPSLVYGLIRGPNTDSGPCTLIPYTFTLNPDNTFSFVADKGDQKVIVEYTVVWAPVAIDPTPGTYTPGAGMTAGWTQRRPLFAWGMAAPGPGDYVPALACVIDDVTAGLGALPMIPDVDPFHLNSHTQYLPGTQAAMCVAQHGWTSVGGGNVLYWTKIIDSDGFGKLP
jgi:Divergent InlB B-repeat domain